MRRAVSTDGDKEPRTYKKDHKASCGSDHHCAGDSHLLVRLERPLQPGAGVPLLEERQLAHGGPLCHPAAVLQPDVRRT